MFVRMPRLASKPANMRTGGPVIISLTLTSSFSVRLLVADTGPVKAPGMSATLVERWCLCFVLVAAFEEPLKKYDKVYLSVEKNYSLASLIACRVPTRTCKCHIHACLAQIHRCLVPVSAFAVCD